MACVNAYAGQTYNGIPIAPLYIDNQTGLFCNPNSTCLPSEHLSNGMCFPTVCTCVYPTNNGGTFEHNEYTDANGQCPPCNNSQTQTVTQIIHNLYGQPQNNNVVNNPQPPKQLTDIRKIFLDANGKLTTTGIAILGLGALLILIPR